MNYQSKHLVLLCDFDYIDNLFVTWKSHLTVFDRNFKNIHIINTHNLQYGITIKKKYKFTNSLIGSFKNIKLLNVKNTKEFIDFRKNKKILIINIFGTSFKELKIHFLLKKLNLKQIQITTLGNEQYSNVLTKSPFKKKLFYFFEKKIPPFLTKILVFLNLINRIDVRFISNKNIIKNIYKSRLKKFLYQKKFFFAKKIILVNSLAFDNSMISKEQVSQDYIVHIDAALNYNHKTAVRGKLSEDSIKKHYYYLNIFLDKVSKYFKKKVIVCIHPSYNIKEHKKYLNNFRVFKFKTREFIRKAYLVTFFDSTTILDAVILNKRIIGLISKFTSDNDIKRQYAWSNNIKCVKQTLSEDFIFNKKEINKLSSNKDYDYKDYIETYLKRKNNNLGVQEIIKYINKYL